MSRNTQHQFVDTDVSKLDALLVAGYEQIFGTAVRPGSPDRLFISWVEDAIIYERELNNYTGNQNLPSRAEGDNLDGLAELFYLQERPKPTAATCTVRFSLSAVRASAVLIPAGTRVTDSSVSLYWVTEEDEYIKAGEAYKDVSVTCVKTGTVGNGYAIGQINTIVDVFDYYTSCSNITRSSNGSDSPEDDEFYELMRESQSAWSVAGPVGAYVYFAKSVNSDIADAVANSPTPGTVCLYAIMSDGTVATEETKKAMVAKCTDNPVRPLTDYVVSADPEQVMYNIDLTYYITREENVSASDIAAAVDEAVQNYISWQSAKMGRDINPDKLRKYLLDVGVKRMVITEPVFTILRDGAPSLDLTADEVPQVAKLGTITVKSGGYEDE